jgi:hypothetical protein
MLWYYVLSMYRQNRTHDGYRLEIGGVLPEKYLIDEY